MIDISISHFLFVNRTQQRSETKEDLSPIRQQLLDVYTSRNCGESSLTVTMTIVVPRRRAQLGLQLIEIRLLLAMRTWAYFCLFSTIKLM